MRELDKRLEEIDTCMKEAFAERLKKGERGKRQYMDCALLNLLPNPCNHHIVPTYVGRFLLGGSFRKKKETPPIC